MDFYRFRTLLILLLFKPKLSHTNDIVNEKALRETQTLRAFFRSAAVPLPGDAGPPKFNQLEMLTTFT